MIDINHLDFSYPHYGKVAQNSSRFVLKDFSCSVRQGERLLIIAPPDSGKTTLAKILILGIPTYGGGELKGSFSIDGKQMSELESYDLVETISYIGQNPQEQLLMNTCSDEIIFPLEALGLEKQEIKRALITSLEHWGLTQLADVHPQELSGGERKRLLLAVSEAIDANVWILDEVFDDLDDYYKQKLLTALKERKGCSITFASRFLPEFTNFFTSIGTIREGSFSYISESEIVDEQIKEKKRKILREKHSSSHFLRMEDGIIVHERKSVKSGSVFTLNVDDFHVEQGEIVALVGPNGSGKSTLSRTLCGLDKIMQGTISVDNTAMNQHQLKERVGYLFQNPDYFLFLPTVFDELTFSLRSNTKMSHKEKEELALECANLFHLNLTDNPTMMSYGERKRLQAAVYYLLKRSFLIIDEIDSGITYTQAYEIIARYQELGCGLIIISHDASFASSLADRTYEIVDNHVLLRKKR